VRRKFTTTGVYRPTGVSESDAWRRAGAALEAIMIWGHIQANWKRFQPQIRHRWDKLTDDDVARIKGHRGVLIDCLQQRYGCGREEAQQEVRRWEHQF
jgi:uncharacterized protein YjbJ (UPF0337 family)